MRTSVTIALLVFLSIVGPRIVLGLFWDFSSPTSNSGQAAVGGAFLGAAGLLSFCWIKGGCGGNRGKRDTEALKNVSSLV